MLRAASSHCRPLAPGRHPVIWVDRKFNRPPIPIDDIDINLVRDSSHLRLRRA